ncbi:hypothetical protein EON80_19435 [bacterium]|nr:MAG: hypothetical protein EON80_19435 [bacterium]
MNPMIQTCRDNFGPASRTFPLSQRRYLLPRLPRWCAQSQLAPLQQQRINLLRQGQVVASALIQANWTLYRPMPEDAPALVVWSEEPNLANDDKELRCLAKRINDLRYDGTGGDLAELGELVNNEHEFPLQYAVPPSLAENTYMTTILVFRRHMPSGFISSRLLPLLVLPEVTSQSLILPGKYWPQELIDR